MKCWLCLAEVKSVNTYIIIGVVLKEVLTSVVLKMSPLEGVFLKISLY